MRGISNIAIKNRFPVADLKNIKPPRSPLKARLQKLYRIGLPKLTEPIRFVRKLKEIELELGTCHATLIGQLVISGRKEVKEVSAEIDKFEDIFSMVPRSIYQPSFNIYKLFEFFRPLMVYAQIHTVEEARQGWGTDFSMALSSMEANISGGKFFVGRCALSASIFTLIVLRIGELAGEASKKNSIHIYSYVLTGGKGFIYDQYNNGKVEIGASRLVEHNMTRNSLMLSSSFSMIASLLNSRVYHLLDKGEIDLLPHKEKEEIFDKLLREMAVIASLDPVAYKLEEHLCAVMAELGNDLYYLFRLGFTPRNLEEMFPSLMVRF